MTLDEQTAGDLLIGYLNDAGRGRVLDACAETEVRSIIRSIVEAAVQQIKRTSCSCGKVR